MLGVRAPWFVCLFVSVIEEDEGGEDVMEGARELDLIYDEPVLGPVTLGHRFH